MHKFLVIFCVIFYYKIYYFNLSPATSPLSHFVKMSGYPKTAIDAFVDFVKREPEGSLKSNDLARLYLFSSEIKEIRSTRDWKPTLAVKQSNGRLKTIPSTDPKDLEKNIFKIVFVEPVLGGGGQAPVVAQESSSVVNVSGDGQPLVVNKFTEEQTKYGDELYKVISLTYSDNVGKIVGMILDAYKDNICEVQTFIDDREALRQLIEEAYQVLNS